MVIDLQLPVVGIYRIGEFYFTIFEQSNQGSKLKCTPWLSTCPDSIIHLFNVLAIGGTRQIRNSLYLTRSNFHYDDCAVIGIIALQLLRKCTRCHVLQIDINRRNNIVTILRGNVVCRPYRDELAPWRALHYPHSLLSL